MCFYWFVGFCWFVFVFGLMLSCLFCCVLVVVVLNFCWCCGITACFISGVSWLWVVGVCGLFGVCVLFVALLLC